MQQAVTVTGYHAHVYFDENRKTRASWLREAVQQRFDVSVGRWRDQAYGPHPCGAYQLAFDAAQFGELVPWLMLNRGELDILVHPLSGDDVEDHSDFAMWLGQPLDLDIAYLRERGQRRDGGGN
ncbi:DOPA 4,5-dioxygenase family protein [Chromobacterium vaccinii]|uniref:DOPA 4,5-dioxygenase family protein n=1 Tax=Chromobacterium vaccinii TaxID=1108595 RepID=UPI0031D7E101